MYLKKSILFIIALFVLCSCSNSNNSSTRLNYTLSNNEYIVYMKIPTHTHWSFDTAWRGFLDAANFEGVSVVEVAYNTDNSSNYYCKTLESRLKSGYVRGIYTPNIDIATLPYFEEITQGIPVLTRLSCSPEEIGFLYPHTTNILYSTLSDEKEALVGIEYIQNHYGVDVCVGYLFGQNPDNFKKIEEVYYKLNEKYTVIDYLHVGANDTQKKILGYISNNDIDVLLVDHSIDVSLLENICADIIYIGTDIAAVEKVCDGNIKAVIAQPIYEYGRRAFYDLMCAVKGYEYPYSVTVEPIIIDSYDDALSFIADNQSGYSSLIDKRKPMCQGDGSVDNLCQGDGSVDNLKRS